MEAVISQFYEQDSKIERYLRHNVYKFHHKYDLGKQTIGLKFQLHVQFQ